MGNISPLGTLLFLTPLAIIILVKKQKESSNIFLKRRIDDLKKKTQFISS